MGQSAAIWDQRLAVENTKDWSGCDQVILRVPRGASARISLLGGRVVSWRNEHGEELLFTSNKANFNSGKTTRGGIAICFPQFRDVSSLERHGFARNKIWMIDHNPPPLDPKDYKGNVFVDLITKPSEDDLKCWPCCFELRQRISLSMDGNLSLVSHVRNLNGKPLCFTFVYHTYLSVSDISEVRIEGLETLDYLDNLCQRRRFTEQADAITFESEVDRVYLNSPDVVAVLDHEKKRTFVIRKEGLPDVELFPLQDGSLQRTGVPTDEDQTGFFTDIRICAAVWNPWEKKSKSMADLGDEEYKQMVCVDAAVIERPITLKPGEQWKGKLELSVVPSSFCVESLGLLQGF